MPRSRPPYPASMFVPVSSAPTLRAMPSEGGCGRHGQIPVPAVSTPWGSLHGRSKFSSGLYSSTGISCS